MHILLRGLRVEVPDDDPRALEIERVLFGTRTPPAPVAEPATAQAAPEPSGAHVPPEFERFWRLLKAAYRAELELLAASPREWPVAELERALGVGSGALCGLHAVLNRFAKQHGLPRPVRKHGYGAERRRYSLRPQMVEWVAALVAAGGASSNGSATAATADGTTAAA